MAFKSFEGKPLAFHTQNLELATLTQEAFNYLKGPSSSPSEERDHSIVAEFKNWSNINQLSESYSVQTQARKVDTLLINNTQICNLKCIYCAAGGDGTYGDPVAKISVEKTLPMLEFFLKKLSKGDQFRINFAGGEPLLHPQAIEAIVIYAQKMATELGIYLKVVVTTNGTCIDEKVLSILGRVQAFVNVSLDGPPSVNDRLRPQKNGDSVTAKIILGLKLLLSDKSGLSGVGLTAVFNKLHSDVLLTYEFFKDFPVDWYEFNFSHTEHDSEASQKFSRSYLAAMKLAWDLGGEPELLKFRSVNQIFTRMDERAPVNSFCGIHQNLLVMDARSQFYACPWDVGNKKKLINSTEILSSSPEDQKNLLQKATDAITEVPPCSSCWAQKLCGGGCEFVHQRSGGYDKNFCIRTKSLIQESLVFYEKSRRF
jgi:uncharacterized protein